MGSPLYPHEERQSEDKKVGMVGPGTGENREGEKRRSHNEFLPLSLSFPPLFSRDGYYGEGGEKDFLSLAHVLEWQRENTHEEKGREWIVSWTNMLRPSGWVR